MGREALEELVLLGDAFATRPDHRCRPHAQASPSGSARLLRPPDHQCGCRGAQLTHPSHPRICTRLPQPGQLQDRHLLPLRWPRPLPSNPLTSRKCPFLSDLGPDLSDAVAASSPLVPSAERSAPTAWLRTWPLPTLRSTKRISSGSTRSFPTARTEAATPQRSCRSGEPARLTAAS
jgi:hypothetical protein